MYLEIVLFPVAFFVLEEVGAGYYIRKIASVG